jgi:predicted Ser/Thr protein kinase
MNFIRRKGTKMGVIMDGARQKPKVRRELLMTMGLTQQGQEMLTKVQNKEMDQIAARTNREMEESPMEEALGMTMPMMIAVGIL